MDHASRMEAQLRMVDNDTEDDDSENDEDDDSEDADTEGDGE
ncbi:hypothetical protein [Halorubrum sp. CSM-61]|nr:hypothetical protein [Halorubrum sp. CSM-61]